VKADWKSARVKLFYVATREADGKRPRAGNRGVIV